MSFYWKTRTLISGDYREVEGHLREWKNQKTIKKYKGKKDIYGIMQIHSDEGGLFCLFLKVLGGLKYCEDNGFIPVVDMQSRENIFQTKEERGKLNVWELFFEQPAAVSYDSVKKLPNTLTLHNPMGPNTLMPFFENDEIKKYWRNMVKKYIHLSKDVQDLLASYEGNIFDGSKVVGVLARGTDYKKGVANGHPIQPDINELKSQIDICINEKGCSKIFLATEDQKILDELTKEYGNKIFTVSQKRYNEEINSKLGHRKDYANISKDMNKAYLTSIVLLSKCDCFVSGLTTGMLGAYMFSEGYEYEHVFFKGYLGDDD